LEKEQKTIGIMIQIFCGVHHGTDRKLLCPTCAELSDYAKERLNKCPYGENKGACSKCEIHCYKPDMRKRITEVMRFSGPRMVRKHPVMRFSGPRMVRKHPLLAIDHLLRLKASGRRKTI